MCWKRWRSFQSPAFKLKDYWIPRKRGDLSERASVSSISFISSLNMTPYLPQHTDPMWSDTAYRISSLDRYMRMPFTWKKNIPIERPLNCVHTWTITLVLRNYTVTCCQLPFCLLWMLLIPVKGKKATNNYTLWHKFKLVFYSEQPLSHAKPQWHCLISLDVNCNILQSWTWEEVAGFLFWNGFGTAVTVTLRYLLVSDSVDTVENWVLWPWNEEEN